MKFNEIVLNSFRQAAAGVLMDSCVIVPVKNEAEHLRVTLKSLFEQVDENGLQLPLKSYEVLVLVNNSDDESLDIALKFKLANPSFVLHVASVDLPQELANIGTVRKLLMDEASRRFQSLGLDRGIIASIDGDTEADPQWLFQIRKEINIGNDAVGGRIFTRDRAGSAEKCYLKDTIYRSLQTEAEQILCPQINDPLPRHFQFFGANMAVTAELYRKSGGIPLVDSLEDMAFHRALMRCDARIRRSLNVRVTTSVRFDGRVEIGFSEQLRKWSGESREGKQQIVENSDHFIYACFLKGQFKAHWENKRTFDNNAAQINDLALALAISPRWLKKQIMSNDFFGSCWEIVWEASPVRQNSLNEFEPIDSAIKKLKKFIQKPDVIVFQTNPAGRFQHADAIDA